MKERGEGGRRNGCCILNSKRSWYGLQARKKDLILCTFENLVWEDSWHLVTYREMTSEKRGQEFHSDDASLPRSGQGFWFVENLIQPIRSTTQIWVATSHQYGISALVFSQTSFRGGTSGGVSKCRLFSPAIENSGKYYVSCYNCYLRSVKFLKI